VAPISRDIGLISQDIKSIVQAIYGNAVYSQLKSGVIYVFKISETGQVYPETVPEI